MYIDVVTGTTLLSPSGEYAQELMHPSCPTSRTGPLVLNSPVPTSYNISDLSQEAVHSRCPLGAKAQDDTICS